MITLKSPVFAALLATLMLATPVAVVAEDLSPQEVIDALKKGREYFKSKQNSKGDWPYDYSGQEGGVACLCTLALLNAGPSGNGDPLKEDMMAKALAYVRHLRPKTTYVMALQTMVLCRADPKADQDLIGNNVDWLQKEQIKDGAADRKGGWSYGENPLGARATQGDGSNSQFALLALYEAARAAEKHKLSIKISRETWERARSYSINNQREEDGGWGYYRPMDATGSMTCAGISSLVISDDVLHEPDARVTGDTIDGCYRAPSEDRERIDRGIEWLRRNFTIQANPPSVGGSTRLWHYYFLYGMERACRLSARRKIGEHDWYREGAKYLVREVDTLHDNMWRGSGHAEENPEIATSLALLFLSKGRWPVLMAKAQYGSARGMRVRDMDITWNRHRSDVNNLTIYTEAAWNIGEMTWQEMDIGKASVDDLLQVPVLFFSGGGNPLPENEEARQRLADNLRDYIDRGGFIFADGDPCSSEFDKGFRELMDLVFRKPEYRFKKLDASHPVWTADQKIDPDQARLLLGIDYGCRTSVIYAPVDPPGNPRPSLACLWELSRGGPKETYSRAVKDQIQGGLAIGVNVLAYATNHELKPKEQYQEHQVTGTRPDPVERGKFAIAKLEHPGGCDAAPRALANLMEQAAHELGIRVETHPKMIGITDPSLFKYTVVFMHGRNAFRLTENERKALRTFVERGGVLFADSICGSEPFADSFRREMGLIFPKNPLMPIPASDPIWTVKYGGADLKTVKRRDPQPQKPGEAPKSTLRDVPPELKAIRFSDHYGVIFSEFDLSCALEKHDSAECRGYTREDAARIGLNVIRYAMQ